MALVLPAIVFPSRASGAPGQEGGPILQNREAVFGDVEGKEWFLLEFTRAGKTIAMDRKALEAIGMGGVYTINFRQGNAAGGNQVSGLGAPNRYFGPFTTGDNRTLSIGNLASTMMLAFIEPDGLKEYEYFSMLSRLSRWNLRDGKLTLYSSDSDGNETVMVFENRS